MAQQHEEMDYTDMPVGEILRRTRMHYNQSLDDIERALRIRACQIEAIELNDLDKLPGRVYAIGFVRSYSEYLGLDGDKMVGLFKKQAGGKTAQPELHFPIGASDGSLPAWWLIALSSVAAIVFLAFWLSGTEEQRKMVEDIPQVPAGMAVLDEPIAATQSVTVSDDGKVTISNPDAQAEGPPVAEEEENEIAEKPAEGIILNIKQNSWVEIRDKSGKAMISRVLKAGDQYYVPDRPDLTISIGNAAGVEIEVDGQPLRQLGETGKVLRRLPLDAKYLKENFAVETAQ